MSLILDEHANTIAEELTGRPYISFSAIGSYRQCPLRYVFKYVEGLPEVTVSASLVLGSGIHSAAEYRFNQLMVGNPAPDQDTLLAVFWDAWHMRAEEAESQFNKTKDVNAIGNTADRILAEFRRSAFAKPAGHSIGVEEQLRGEVVTGVPDLLARIDLIVESEDAVIHVAASKSCVCALPSSPSRSSAGGAYRTIIGHLIGQFADFGGTVADGRENPRTVNATRKVTYEKSS